MVTGGTCSEVIVAPNGWAHEVCGRTVQLGGLCRSHLKQRTDNARLREEIHTMPMTQRTVARGYLRPDETWGWSL